MAFAQVAGLRCAGARSGGRVVRVLLSSTWGVGHVFPMVPLARALVAAGHEVLWVAPAPAVELVQDASLPARAGGLSRAGVLDAVARMRSVTAPLPPADRAAVAFREMFAARACPAMVDDLLEAGRAFRPDLVLHEPAELAAPLVAALLGVPCVTHSWGQAVPAPILQSAAGAVAATWEAHDREVPPYAGFAADGYLDLCPPAVRWVATDHVPAASPMRPVPWSGPEDAVPVPTGVTRRPLVYVTLGTVFSDTHVLQAAVDAAAATGAGVVVAVGPHLDPAVIARPHEQVQVLSWVPQAALLPTVDLVVSHGGSGTFLGALGSGLPQLCLPQAADQFRNANALTRSGAGLALEPHELTPEALGRALRELLGEPRYREAAGEVAGQIAAMPHPEEVARDLARAHG